MAAQIGVLLAGIAGAGVGYYCGFQLVIPIALACGVGWLLTKIPASPSAFRIAWTFGAAQILWMVLGAALVNAWSQVALDIGVLGAGLAWLWVRPGLGPVTFLGLYQIGSTVINIMALISSPLASQQNKALVAHLYLRVGMLAFLVAGYVKSRKRKDA